MVTIFKEPGLYYDSLKGRNKDTLSMVKKRDKMSILLTSDLSNALKRS